MVLDWENRVSGKVSDSPYTVIMGKAETLIWGWPMGPDCLQAKFWEI